MPIKAGSQITGVLFRVIDVSVVKDIVAENKIGETGYAFVLRDD